jgi:dipeptidyl aminopeptidase/acylaminoacyl peptidase
VIPTPDSLASVAVSPDGTRITAAYGDEDEDGGHLENLFLVDTRAPKNRSLLLIAKDVACAAWAPDGRKVAVATSDGIAVLNGLDPWFRTHAIQRLSLSADAPMLFSPRGDWLIAHRTGGGPGDFFHIRFDRMHPPVAKEIHLGNAYTPSLIRYPGNAVAVVGEGIAVGADGRVVRVKPTGTIGLYNVHSDPAIWGIWCLTFDMDTASVDDGEVFEVTGTRAWLENVLTGRRMKIKWPKARRVLWVQAFGSSSFLVQADDETLLSGKFDRFRRYRLVWK